MRPSKLWLLLTLIVLAVLGGRSAPAAEIVFSDGRHETVKAPRQDSKGRWLAEREGRVTILRPGDVVVVVDDAGAETVTIPDLVQTPDPPQTAAFLAALSDLKNDAWRQACDELGRHPSTTTLTALVAMSSDKKKGVRLRAVQALVLLRTRESTVAAANAALAERDKSVRRQAVSALFQVQEIFRRSEVTDVLAAGLVHKDVDVRVSFALLAPRDVTEAADVLRTDGIKHSDHHYREDAALGLGRRGDASGERILAGMLTRTRMPGIEGDAELTERLLVREQVEICGIFGELRTASSRAALKKATKSKLLPVREAAAAALARFEDE